MKQISGLNLLHFSLYWLEVRDLSAGPISQVFVGRLFWKRFSTASHEKGERRKWGVTRPVELAPLYITKPKEQLHTRCVSTAQSKTTWNKYESTSWLWLFYYHSMVFLFSQLRIVSNMHWQSLVIHLGAGNQFVYSRRCGKRETSQPFVGIQ